MAKLFLRIDEDVGLMIKGAAKANSRSATKEANHRLRISFRKPLRKVIANALR